MNSFQKNHDSNKLSCLYQSTWRNGTSSFCSIFFITFTRAVSYFHSYTVRIIFLCGMTMVSIIISQEKELWLIIMGGKTTNRFLETKKMSDGIISGVQRDILSGQGISSMVMGGRFKDFIPQSVGKDYLSSHKLYYCFTLSLKFSCPHFPLKFHDRIVSSHI